MSNYTVYLSQVINTSFCKENFHEKLRDNFETIKKKNE